MSEESPRQNGYYWVRQNEGPWYIENWRDGVWSVSTISFPGKKATEPDVVCEARLPSPAEVDIREPYYQKLGDTVAKLQRFLEETPKGQVINEREIYRSLWDGLVVKGRNDFYETAAGLGMLGRTIEAKLEQMWQRIGDAAKAGSDDTRGILKELDSINKKLEPLNHPVKKKAKKRQKTGKVHRRPKDE